jgi:hypothetical protein
LIEKFNFVEILWKRGGTSGMFFETRKEEKKVILYPEDSTIKLSILAIIGRLLQILVKGGTDRI